MSIFSSLDTAVSGLTSQSVAFSNISNNISNSQTVGYKAVDTSFSDLVEASGAVEGQSGDVTAATQYQNQAQGTITASSANGALAVNGNGFFLVSETAGSSTPSTPTFSTNQYYTRAGDFSSDQNGYLVNSAGEYLDGYTVNPTTGTLGTSITQINVSNIKPTATTSMTIDPVLAGGSAAGSNTMTETVYDSSGNAQTLTLAWSQTTAATATTGSTWTLNVSGPVGVAATATVAFNQNGTLATVTQGGTTSATGTVAIPAGNSTSAINLTLGTPSAGTASGGTTVSNAGTVMDPGTVSQNGTGVYTGFSMETDGSVMANFSNGQTQLIAKVPLATFANANGLQAQDGQAYTATAQSGTATVQLAGQNQAGTLETKSVEGSTTSLDTDLTKLIVAQQAYGASAKVVTTANDMLQTALSMKQ